MKQSARVQAMMEACLSTNRLVGVIPDEYVLRARPEFAAFQVALSYMCSCHGYTLTVEDLTCNKYGRPKEKVVDKNQVEAQRKTTASSKSKPDLIIYYDVEINGVVYRMYGSACSFMALAWYLGVGW
mgnify:CR=1 FL=1